MNTVTGRKVEIQYKFSKYIMEGLGLRHCIHNIIDATASWGQAKFDDVRWNFHFIYLPIYYYSLTAFRWKNTPNETCKCYGTQLID